MLSLRNDAMPVPIARTRSATTRTRCLSAKARIALTPSILGSSRAIYEQRASYDDLVAGFDPRKNFRFTVASAADFHCTISEAVIRMRKPHMRVLTLKDQRVFRDGGRNPVVTGVNSERREHHRPEHAIGILQSRPYSEPMRCRVDFRRHPLHRR